MYVLVCYMARFVTRLDASKGYLPMEKTCARSREQSSDLLTGGNKATGGKTGDLTLG